MHKGKLKHLLCAGVLLVANPASAGQVYGTVSGGSGPIRDGLVRVACPNTTASERRTDRYGTYSVYVNGSGRCTISVNNSKTLSIRVYDDEVRYDLRLSRNTLTLR